jgi:hypothetical protein
MPTLIDSTVTATIRHSDSEPIASAAATASVNRDEAAGALRPLKPAAPGDRVMVQILQSAGRITRSVKANLAILAGNNAAVAAAKTAESRQRLTLCPRSLRIGPVGDQAPAGAMLAGSSTSVGSWSIDTNPGVRSTRRNQVRIAGNVARS